ncbi:MAG TPA: divergent polysaccharide deacetylase family protein [Patescibacteria group bacterium]|nr:divergent polysaccharide deacetylase family protein [Patescibacteria group bacterium]
MHKDSAYRLSIFFLLILVVVEGFFLLRLLKPPAARAVKPKPRPAAAVAKGKIAIVLDDWGYNLNNEAVLARIKYPLTLSVLPNLPYSVAISEKARRLGFETILHLPMEPHEKYRLEHNTILTTMDEAAITGIMAQDLREFPGIKGISNHQGSKATEDPRTMKIIFAELKNRGLYFLDSVVSAHSVCSGLARSMKIGFARRDVFLDNSDNPEYIKAQLQKLKAKARSAGYAIGIGHDRKNTLQVLEEMMPLFAQEGYTFVFVSELAWQ